MTSNNDEARQLLRQVEALEREVAQLKSTARGRLVRETTAAMQVPPGGLSGQVLLIIDDVGTRAWDWPRAHNQTPFV